jgi:hypothetical protein
LLERLFADDAEPPRPPAPAIAMLHHPIAALLLATLALAQDPPPPLGDHLEPYTAIDREHAHHAGLDGTVLGNDGKPLAGAKVYVHGQLPWWGWLPMAQTTTDAEGRYRFDDITAIGMLVLFATTPDAAPFTYGGWSIGLVSGRRTSLRPVTLPPPIAGAEPFVFRGRLVDGKDAPLAGAMWWLHRGDDFDPGAFAVTDADGRFAVRCGLGKPDRGMLILGKSKFEFEHQDGAEHFASDASLRNDLDLVTERTIRMPSAGSLPLAAPDVPGAAFFVARGQQLTPCVGNMAVQRKSDYGDHCTVWMRAPGRLPRQRTLPKQGFDLDGDRARSLRVVDDEGQPVAGALVDVCNDAPAARLEEMTLDTYRTDADGTLSLQGPADPHVVYVYADGHAPARARWSVDRALQVVLRRHSARLELEFPADSSARVYVRAAGTFASCAKLFPVAGTTTVPLLPGDYEVTVYDDDRIDAAVALRVEGTTKLVLPTEDQRPNLLVTVAEAAQGDDCWAFASRSASGGMITKWRIHTQGGGPMMRHELAATVKALDAEPDAAGRRRFRVRPPTSGRYTVLIGNGDRDEVRLFCEADFAFGAKYELLVPAATAVLEGSVKDYPEIWKHGPIHGVVGPRLCLEPAGDTRIGALVALPEPAKFQLGSLLPGSYTLHHHLYETGILQSDDGTWGGQPLTIAKEAPGQTGELGRAPGHELTVVVRDRDGRPLQGRLTIRDRMFECWTDDLRQNTTLDDAADPIPTPPGTELVDGTGKLKNVRSGRIAFVLQLDDGQSVHFVRDVDVTKPLEVRLAALPR